MSIVNSKTLVAQLVMLHTVTVLELRTVIYGDGLESAFGEFPDDFIQGSDSSSAGLSSGAEDDFIAGFGVRLM